MERLPGYILVQSFLVNYGKPFGISRLCIKAYIVHDLHLTAYFPYSRKEHCIHILYRSCLLPEANFGAQNWPVIFSGTLGRWCGTALGMTYIMQHWQGWRCFEICFQNVCWKSNTWPFHNNNCFCCMQLPVLWDVLKMKCCEDLIPSIQSRYSGSVDQ
jgi:hypothetical protein